jgi:hypothetical protein
MVLKPTRSPAVDVAHDAARLAEVDVAGQLAHDQDVEPGDDFGLQRRGVGQFRVEDGRAQVGEQAELLADAEQARSGRCARGSVSHFGPPTAPSRTASAARASFERRFRVGIAGRVDRGSRRAAPLRHLDGRPAPSARAPPGGDLGADAVTRQHANLHVEVRVGLKSRRLSGEQPGLLDAALFFEGADLVGVAQGQADVVPAVEQAVLAEGSTSKGIALPSGGPRPARQVDQQPVARRRLDLSATAVDLGRRQRSAACRS